MCFTFRDMLCVFLSVYIFSVLLCTQLLARIEYLKRKQIEFVKKRKNRNVCNMKVNMQHAVAIAIANATVIVAIVIVIVVALICF